ncbi:hypothetical protein [Streptomyces apocyni]|uniref:hypothetical protein n=1 Tax=Streptomyces apocyni TaxID=2654677 RepID=UPI0012EB0510|nr:hypothetical protein [Streptomyces apocyni]
MSRRVSLPGADELFRTTGGMALTSSSPRRPANGEARVPAPAGESDGAAAGEDDGESAEHSTAEADSSDHRSRGAEGVDAEGRTKRRQAQEAASAPPSSPSARTADGSAGSTRRRGRAQGRRPSGRERHDEKITVYVSAEELMDLEHARLVLRGEHGLAVDRGRIVREAVAVVLADLESRGEASILVRRLRGR